MEKHQFRYCTYITGSSDDITGSSDDITEDHMIPGQGDEYVCEEDWGEQLTSVVDPVVVVMSVQSEECEVVEVGKDVSGESGECVRR